MKYILILILSFNFLFANDLENGLEALKSENYELAVEYFEKSASGGNAIAKYNLAVMYNNGLGVKRDTDKSSKWIEKATKDQNEKGFGKYSIKELKEFADYSEKYSKDIPVNSTKKPCNSFALID